jgi:hypothetical protein
MMQGQEPKKRIRDLETERARKRALRADITWRVWTNIRSRCNHKGRSDYAHYGARGIRVCAEWRSYARFLADMGPRPSEKHTIDRLDNDRGYEPGNCRWATMLEQENNRRNNIKLTHDGETMNMSQWARRYGMSGAALRQRLVNGWSMEMALTAPVRAKRKALTVQQSESARAI